MNMGAYYLKGCVHMSGGHVIGYYIFSGESVNMIPLATWFMFVTEYQYQKRVVQNCDAAVCHLARCVVYGLPLTVHRIFDRPSSTLLILYYSNQFDVYVVLCE
jgi:hypothetical protein